MASERQHFIGHMKKNCNRTGDPACVCCFETSCFGCEIVARANDPDYKEIENDDEEDPNCRYEP